MNRLTQEKVRKLVADIEAEAAGKTTLEYQLEQSLWALATIHRPAFTREELASHVGPGHMQGEWYVKRVYGYSDEVHLLCPCKTILVLQRCYYGGAKTANFENPERCEEPAFPDDGTFRTDMRCVQHKGM